MPRWKAGGYVIQQYATDHLPLHVHVYLDRTLIAKVEVPSGAFDYLNPQYANHAGRVLEALRSVGLI